MYILNTLTKCSRLNTIKLLPYTQQSMRCLQFEPKKTSTVNPQNLRIRGEDSYRRMDGVSSDHQLIYNNQIHYTLNVGKLLGVTMVPPVVGLQLYYHWTGTMPITETVKNTTMSFNYATDTPIAAVAFVIMNILVTFVCHAFTLRIYKKDDKYIAIMPGYLPRINSKVYFKKGEVKPHSWFPKSIFDMFQVSGRGMILLLQRFRRPVDFYEMLHKSIRR